MKLFLYFFFLLSNLSIFSQSNYCPPNVDFENGDFSNWSFEAGSCCPLNFSSTTPLSNRHELIRYKGKDEYGGFSVVAPGSSYSLKIGNNINGSEAEAAYYTLNIPFGLDNYSLIYKYAVVFEDPEHFPDEQPRFKVEAFDQQSGTLLPCANFEYVASSKIPGFQLSNFGDNVLYKPWSSGSLDLSGYAGRTVVIKFSVGDCALGGHFGYGYVDLQCSLFKIVCAICSGKTNQKLIAPPGYETYTWYDSSFKKVLGTGEILYINNPSKDSLFKVIVTPFDGYGCPDTLESKMKIASPTSSNITDVLCEDYSKYPYNNSGTYVDTFINANGCDSIRTLKLTVIPKVRRTIEKIICSNDSFLGKKSPGVYIDTALSSLGCDSITTLNLTVKAYQLFRYDKFICTGDSFHGHTKTGIYQDNYKTTEGCDSIEVITLKVDTSYKLIEKKIICTGNSYNGHTISGKYLDKYKARGGCDSIIDLKLDVKTTIYKSIDSYFCTRVFHNKEYHYESFVANDTITHNAQCDSSVTVIRFKRKRSDTASFDTITLCGSYIYEGKLIKKDTTIDISTKRSYYPKCDSVHKRLIVKILPYPKSTLSVLPDTFVKENTLVTLEINGGLEYIWNIDSQRTSKIEYLIQDKKYFEVYIKSDNGCDTTLGTWIKIQPEIEWNELFSPNGDGVNDIFSPKIKGDIEFKNFRVYNRLGQILQETTGELPSWDGKFKGIDQPEGTYVYQINYTIKNQLVAKLGAITLVR